MRAQMNAVQAECYQRQLERRRKEWPVLVADHGEIVADTMVIVSAGDVNWWKGMACQWAGMIEVRRQGDEC
jgi:hypothetical protein